MIIGITKIALGVFASLSWFINNSSFHTLYVLIFSILLITGGAIDIAGITYSRSQRCERVLNNASLLILILVDAIAIFDILRALSGISEAMPLKISCTLSVLFTAAIIARLLPDKSKSDE